MTEKLEKIESVTGYTFKDKSLLKEALTHSSYANESRVKGERIECNERLEFFGDSVLSVVVSDYLFKRYTTSAEGDMTKTRAALVCERALAKFARQIDLGEYLFLGHGEEKNNGRNRDSILADAFEALIAALYIDSGSKEVPTDFIIPFVEKELKEIGNDTVYKDYKTLLQQIVQQAEGEKLEYVLTDESGPAHDKRFKVEARLNSNVIGHGTGKSKREAEQQAAKEALVLFGEVDS